MYGMKIGSRVKKFEDHYFRLTTTTTTTTTYLLVSTSTSLILSIFVNTLKPRIIGIKTDEAGSLFFFKSLNIQFSHNFCLILLSELFFFNS
jgi:hypothetical protein